MVHLLFRSTWINSIFCKVHVAQSLVFCVVFCRLLFVFLSFCFWLLYCLVIFHLRLLITHLVSFIAHSMDIVLTVLFPFTASDYPLIIFYCTFNGHCIVSSFSIYGFWLPTWYLLLHIQWPLYWQFFFHLRLLITPLVSFIAHSIKSISTQYGSFIKLFWKYLVFKCSSAQARCTPVSSTNKTEHYDTTEILLNVTLSTITLTLNCCIWR
jgi:hypothetical protein